MNVDTEDLNLERIERETVARALKIAGTIVGAAKRLGMNRHAVRRKMIRHGLASPLRRPYVRKASSANILAQIEKLFVLKGEILVDHLRRVLRDRTEGEIDIRLNVEIDLSHGGDAPGTLHDKAIQAVSWTFRGIVSDTPTADYYVKNSRFGISVHVCVHSGLTCELMREAAHGLKAAIARHWPGVEVEIVEPWIHTRGDLIEGWADL